MSLANLQIRRMTRNDLPQVLAIENDQFEYPWSEEDFIRTLRRRNCIGMVADAGGAEDCGAGEISMSDLPCPCGSKKFQKAGPDLYKCQHCGGLFDNQPDEGGDYGHRPEARLMRQEAARENRRERLGRRLATLPLASLVAKTLRCLAQHASAWREG